MKEEKYIMKAVIATNNKIKIDSLKEKIIHKGKDL